MNRQDIKIRLQIILNSPLIIGNGFGTAGLIDSATVKDTDNIVYIPGTSLKGKIRSEFKKTLEALNIRVCNSVFTDNKEICKDSNIKDACPICRIFGSEFYEGSIIFEDAIMEPEAREVIKKIKENSVISSFQTSLRTGIRINRYLKVVDERALFILEGVNPAIKFKSMIYGSCYITDEEYHYLRETIGMITHIGGNKAGGMGRCTIKVEEIRR